MEIYTRFAEDYRNRNLEEISIQDYLLGCRDDPLMRATSAERMMAAIGEPEVIDTSQDQRLGRIFMNRTIKRYAPFKNLFGMEATIERIVGFFRHASQGLEERKQILYLLGPVGGGKSSIAEILKKLMEQEPIYVLKAGDQISPVYESPLGLFSANRAGDLLEDPTAWVADLFRRLLGREAEQPELAAFVGAFHEPECRVETVLYALVSHPEYHQQ